MGVAGTESRLFGGENAETGLAVDDEAGTDKGVEEGRRCITVFTVTRLVSLEAGSNGMIVPGGFESMRKARVLFGMGGIIRAWYMFFCSWEVFVFVLSKRDFGCGFVFPGGNDELQSH